MIPQLTILIVDDNAQDRAALRRYLERDPEAQYTIIEHPTLEEALETVRNIRPDCVLLDHHLPDGTGLEFMTELSALAGGQIIPVVMMTGTGSETVAVEAMKSGVQDYLIKGHAVSEDVLRAIKGAMFRVHTELILGQQREELERLYEEAREASAKKDQLLTDLKIAKDAAEKANAAKDEFLAALSHELRTPLTPILSAVSALDASTVSREELVRTFTIIQRNIELEARLIDDLLDLTRITRGKLHIERQTVDLHECLRHAEEICAADLVKKNIQVSHQIEAVQHHIAGDSARLQQVFWNILANAVKFTPHGGHISIETRNPPTDGIEVRVRDSGIGIPEENLNSIFNAFDQGPASRAKSGGGLGLGLAIAKALVEAQSGTIVAASEGTGKGAEFRVDLPVAARPRASESPKNEPAPPKEITSRPTILLVEDHLDSADILNRMLHRRGFTVLSAHTVAQALEVFSAQPIDLVISDIGLPDGTGSDLMKIIRQTKDMPAIAVSGFGMEQDLARSTEAGFNAHLIKPVTVQTLENTIRKLLNK